MTTEQFDVTFSGKISDGADLQEVKKRVSKLFNADGVKLDQLFSGQRIVIKKDVDRKTAHRYESALRSAGAECDIRSTSSTGAESFAAAPPAAAVAAPTRIAPEASKASEPSAEATSPPQTEPLGINADQISELVATIAPAGSDLQSEIKVIPEPHYDLSGLDLAPVGSSLGEAKKDAAPRPPDSSGLSLLDQ